MPFVFSKDKSIMQTYFEIASDEYPGVYLTWDRLTSDDYGLATEPTLGQEVIQRVYVILRADYINGPYVEIGRAQVPNSEFLDNYGKPTFYYKVQLIQVNLDTSLESVIATSSPISGDSQLIKASLAYEVKHFLDIPVYDDELIFNYDRTQARLGYGMLVYNPVPQIRISAKSNDGFEDPYKIIDFVNGISYDDLAVANASEHYVVNTGSNDRAIEKLFYNVKENGLINFTGLYQNHYYPVSIPAYDSILASYRVKMFTNTEMNDALYQALQYINALPGSPKYRTVEDTPYYYEQALITIATYFLLRRLLMRLTQREIRLLIGDLGDTTNGGAGSYNGGVDMIKNMYDSYKDQAESMRKGAAYAYYPRIKTVTTETFQLPGSRSYLFRSMFKSAGAYG